MIAEGDGRIAADTIRSRKVRARVAVIAASSDSSEVVVDRFLGKFPTVSSKIIDIICLPTFTKACILLTFMSICGITNMVSPIS